MFYSALKARKELKSIWLGNLFQVFKTRSVKSRSYADITMSFV